MSLIEIIILSIALGIDCLVVSFSQGIIFQQNRIKNSSVLALTMGLSQGIMPLFGYFGTFMVNKFVEPFGKWFVFIIFLTLGVNFIFEAFQERKEEICCIGIKCLITMGIATSIDALVSGVSLNLTNSSIFLSAMVIGLVSFLMSLSGFWFGIFFKHLPAKLLSVLGGVILIILAIKALI